MRMLIKPKAWIEIVLPSPHFLNSLDPGSSGLCYKNLFLNLNHILYFFQLTLPISVTSLGEEVILHSRSLTGRQRQGHGSLLTVSGMHVMRGEGNPIGKGLWPVPGIPPHPPTHTQALSGCIKSYWRFISQRLHSGTPHWISLQFKAHPAGDNKTKFPI